MIAGVVSRPVVRGARAGIRLLAGLMLLIGMMALSTQAAFAGCYICWPEGDCWYNEGSCADFNPDGPYDATCEECELSVNNDYFTAVGGQVWLHQGKLKRPVLPDGAIAFLKGLERKYPKATWNDPAVRARANAEVAAFMKSGKVSSARLKAILKKTGLKLRAAGPR